MSLPARVRRAVLRFLGQPDEKLSQERDEAVSERRAAVRSLSIMLEDITDKPERPSPAMEPEPVGETDR